jgi:signal transduction histidine kinase/ActR/RegA family two-component response regulator
MNGNQSFRESSRGAAPGATATLEEVDILSELQSRPYREPNYEAEHGALAKLAMEMATKPRDMLQKLVETALELCRADTAGISLLEGDVFRWEALAGVFASLRNSTMPREASPCGVCIDQDSTQLMFLADRCFPALKAEPRFVEALLIPFHHNGRPIGTVWIVAHNDERKFDREDERILRTLANFASAGWQLWKRYEDAAESGRHKDDFVALLGHEFRNPLAAILNANEVIHKIGRNNPNLQLASDVVTRQAQHLCRMVDDLIDLSRVSRGRLELQKEPVQIRTVVTQALEMTRAQIDRHGHHLSVLIANEPMWIEGDPGRLAQMLSNLLDNAVKYTPDGGQISIVAEPLVDQVCVKVSDNGIGIDKDQLAGIFGLYAQLGKSRTTASRGLGLGLALVRSLLDLHGGNIKVISGGPGKGSQFTICLPILPPAQRANAKEATKQAPVTTHRRILLVEDNADVAETMEQILAMDGHTVCVATEGEMALQKLRSFEPEVVLLDLSLPDIDGYEVARQMRKDSAGKDLLILALSGYAQEDHRRRSKEAGCDEHLVKPVQVDVLQTLLRSAPGTDRNLQPEAKLLH